MVFIYALSPGLDMVFSSSKEVDTLKNKIKQVCSYDWLGIYMVPHLPSMYKLYAYKVIVFEYNSECDNTSYCC